MSDGRKSLREMILLATSEEDIQIELAAGARYKWASTRTRARWRSAAKKRRKELA